MRIARAVVATLGTLAAASLLDPVVPPAHAALACRFQLWVSPDGSDTAAGDRTHPFRTLERARDAARSAAQRAACSVVVNLADGVYRLDRSLTLDARDSGAEGREMVYRAAPGAHPVISGAVRVGDWSVYDAARGIQRAFVGGLESRQLYVDGVRATRARGDADAAYLVPTPEGYRYAKPGSTGPAWSNPTRVEIFTFAQWKIMSCPVGTVMGDEILMQQPCWKNANVFPAPWNFRLVTHVENAYELLDEPGEWYLDSDAGWLYYLPRPGEDLATADVELPVLEVLVDGGGELGAPVANIRFEDLTFAYATWLGPSGPDGYVSDQSGFHVVGDEHAPNLIGHVRDVARTPGNVRFRYAQHVTFADDVFTHLGGVGLDFDTGSQDDAIVDSTFTDISSAAIQLGGVATVDHHPTDPEQTTRDNLIANNLVESVGRDYVDAAGIYVGFTTRTVVSHNDVVDVPWTGIAIGWGWGLFDQGSFPGLPHATSGMWGEWDTPSTSRGNRILDNRIDTFLTQLWDGGAIYSNGAQGTSFDDGELIAGNVASGKRPDAGGNTFYTDGGSRWVTLFENVSFDNPEGRMDFGPCGLPSSLELCWVTLPYGYDAGGCVPYGDIRYVSNYFSQLGFYDLCILDPPLPVGITASDDHLITGAGDVPERILRAAGRQPGHGTRVVPGGRVPRLTGGAGAG